MSGDDEAGWYGYLAARFLNNRIYACVEISLLATNLVVPACICVRMLLANPREDESCRTGGCFLAASCWCTECDSMHNGGLGRKEPGAVLYLQSAWIRMFIQETNSTEPSKSKGIINNRMQQIRIVPTQSWIQKRRWIKSQSVP